MLRSHVNSLCCLEYEAGPQNLTIFIWRPAYRNRILIRSRQYVNEEYFSALWRLYLCVVSYAVKMVNLDWKWHDTVRLAFPGFYRRRNRLHCWIFCRPLLRAKQVRGEQRRDSFIFCQTRTRRIQRKHCGKTALTLFGFPVFRSICFKLNLIVFCAKSYF